MIFVAINYRLGAFGSMAGPTLQANDTQNAGLYDQLQALHWIQNNIHLFGDDRSKVTFMGESAGDSSAMSHITAYGGRQGPAPFSQAIPQSPGMLLEPGTIQGESTTNAFLSLLNVTSITEARDLPSGALITANAKQIEMSSYSTYTYGPVVDGLIMPAWPSRLLQLGAFDRSVKVMTGHNAFEGGFFPDPKVDSTSSFQEWVGGHLPNLAPSAASQLTTIIYPPIFDGSYGYVDDFSR